MITRLTARLEIYDPGFVRARRGVRAVGATVLAWATMLVVTAVFDVADPVRITLFAAGAAFEGALLAPDPQPRDRVRTLGWAVVVSAVVLVASVHLAQFAVWAAAVLLILLIFLSYALRSWSPRLASLALMGAITTYVAGAGYITPGRIGWFVLAMTVGFAWIAVWESALLPEDPVGSLRRAVDAFLRRTAETVRVVVEVLNTTRDGTPPDRAGDSLRKSLDRVRRCRAAIDTQLPGAALRGVSQPDIDQLGVALYSTQRGLEDIVEQAKNPQWMQALPDQIRWSIANTLSALMSALRDDDDAESHDVVILRAQVLRGHIHDAASPTDGTSHMPRDVLLAVLTLTGGGVLVGQSSSQATALVSRTPSVPGIAKTSQSASVGPTSPALSPTMALAIQAVVAAVVAGLFARAVGNEQSLVVAWTAFVVIGGSVGASTRRAWTRLPATILGAIGGVAIAASVPDTLFWTLVVVAIGVFFTIVSAPVSYPAMVFWLSIALVPLFATEGRYLDLIWDKSIAALIGGGVAAVVALTVVPIRLSRNVRPAVVTYLGALDEALASHLTGQTEEVAAAETELDRAHSALEAILTTATTETQLFPHQGNRLEEQAIHVDAVHEAYLRLTPLLSGPARRLHGWSDERVDVGVRRLRDDVRVARVAASADATEVGGGLPTLSSAGDSESLEVTDSLWRIANLHSRLTELALLLDSRPTSAR